MPYFGQSIKINENCLLAESLRFGSNLRIGARCRASSHRAILVFYVIIYTYNFVECKDDYQFMNYLFLILMKMGQNYLHFYYIKYISNI